MAGNAKFELSSASPEDSGLSGNYSNGPRGSYTGLSLDRSGSFREGSEGRSFSSGTGTSKSNNAAAADLPSLSHFLNLEPIFMGDQKYTRAGELRRALGFSFGNVSEENSFGASHLKPPPTLATDELKRFRASVHEGFMKARTRVKRLDDSLNKLSKYLDVLNPKKQQTIDRSGGSNMLKTTQSHRRSPDLVTQKFEERNKNMVLSKRARTPIADVRAEGRGNGLPRPNLVAGKDKDAAKESNSDLVEEKIRRLPAGGEGWDKRMKRKRSMSSVFHRPLDVDGELKRVMHGRHANDSGVQNSDSHGFRSGTLNGPNGINKLDGTPPGAGLSARMTPKSDMEKASLSREPVGVNKERLLQKGNTKLGMREDSHLFSPGSVTKGKASRAQRTGPPAAGNSPPSISRISGASEDWELPLNVNKVHSLAGVTNRKRPLPTESSSPPMAQWVGQRPQKISRNRRTNIVSPTSNHDEVQTPDGCASDFSPRLYSGMNGSLPVRNITGSSQQLKVKLENASSPAPISECEENSVGEHRPKDKTLGGSEADEKVMNGNHYISSSTLFTKKSKFVMKEEIGDGVRRQGRTGRGSSFSRNSMSPLREKMENPAIGKPVRGTRPGSDKNGSKSGRPPLKKHSDRKGLIRLGTIPNSNSPDFTGESDDDREELLAAAQFACNASYNGCSSLFWKRMETLFYAKLEDRSYLEEQLKSVEVKPNLRVISAFGDNDMNHASKIEDLEPQSFSFGDTKNCTLDNGLPDSIKSRNLTNPFNDRNSSFEGPESGKFSNTLTSLYQRVLSALVADEDFEECEENSFSTNAPSPANRNDPFMAVDRISCNGNATHNHFSSFRVPMDEEMEEGNYSYMHPQTSAGTFQHNVNGTLANPKSTDEGISFECPYDQMHIDKKLILELQSIGLYPETVPDLAEGEDELINEDIIQLKKQLCQQVGKKKTFVDKVHKAMEAKKESEGRELEQRAMNRLIELAYRKLLATRGSSAARIGISKVPRHVALSFIRRTLARCRKFEDGGKSCFADPALRDVLLAVPSSNTGAINSHSEQDMRVETGISGTEQLDFRNAKSERGPFDAYEALANQSDQAFAKNGPILNRGKKKEVLLDDVGGNTQVRSTSHLFSNLSGGAKGKRSERDSGSAKAGRPPISNLRGERKTKSKPKQKAAQISTHPVQPPVSISSEVPSSNSNRKREGIISHGSILDSSKESQDPLDFSNLPLELDAIEDISVGPQDLSSWLNFDEDGLQDHDSMGLEIPMDDLSELNIPL